ncbi:MAG: ABC-F family ATP-binding cassette domain-containing protein [Alphaproteobacteria bacterium]|nr:ABC-F family ATP-binding cassette domain-containing protein [Alphaproteobacteria bacterium]MCB9794711.1 ABC-F family ATP-binding cassette domain-containing protein [Alphaproteobacteria bacterium]
MPLLSARGLRREVEGRLLYEALDIELTENERLGVTGPSGSGKTLLLRALAALDPCEGARLSLRGRSLEDIGPTAWRAALLYVGQRPPRGSDSPADWAERIAGLAAQQGRPSSDPLTHARALELPEATWSAPWSQLSGGEGMRALLALALSREPDALLLDEPSAGLDAARVQALERALAGRSGVVVSHDRALLERLCGRVITLGAP